ncbi:hypothetical protein TTHERM_001123846 (macronuclear) [Tetrahymena thermophila SB210]|uniref:Uncharacterized protein n=1 Tax=Tetrahymena thermophila (strain SB210) TaxID=312017 RepID=W7WX34_TETTS|nr:hypothetical protein TTHERM_001123846 [Tetrahymena thermophila SB210]EWS71360.1 hypothetical protein TTHERM_001123846 [Tetrahymena thermophila SB210]|eukprot:XP_012656093.1 hypothetical protein TTHERM_001123846 [Tetrahymena thermophila SB210]
MSMPITLCPCWQILEQDQSNPIHASVCIEEIYSCYFLNSLRIFLHIFQIYLQFKVSRMKIKGNSIFDREAEILDSTQKLLKVFYSQQNLISASTKNFRNKVQFLHLGQQLSLLQVQL